MIAVSRMQCQELMVENKHRTMLSLFIDLVTCIYCLFLGLQGTTLALDYRVTNLEENGGGNTNITQLETRVTELEVTAGEQETRTTTNQEDIEG